MPALNLRHIPTGTVALSLDTDGVPTFSDYYSNERPTAAAVATELTISRGGASKLWTASNGVHSDIQLADRFQQQAVFPNTGLHVANPDGARVATLGDNGALYTRGKAPMGLADPKAAGAYVATSHVYAAPGLNYAGFGNHQFDAFQTPSANYTTTSVNLARILPGLAPAPTWLVGTWPFRHTVHGAWPFTNAAVPINGLLRVPVGVGPFPLAIIAHGNHLAAENSTPGYLYLCDLLASQGVIAATIDANFLNQTAGKVNDARAILQLEHVKQFQAWNNLIGHPLQGRVDLDRIMLVGHSRGGEAVGHASYFNNLTHFVPEKRHPPIAIDGTGANPLGPYQFGIRAAVALAPTDDQYIPLKPNYPERQFSTVINDNYLVIHGSQDGDVRAFPGYRAYDRAQQGDRNDPAVEPPGIKSLLWIYNANHNDFNTVWQARDDNPGRPDPMSAADQQDVAKVYVAAMAQAFLLGRSQYLDVLKNYLVPVGANWLPVARYVSQFQDNRRLAIQNFQNLGPIEVTAPHVGAANSANITAAKLFFDQNPRSFLYEETGGLRLEWNNLGEHYALTFPPPRLDVGAMQHFAMRVGQSFEGLNPADGSQDFSIEITDGVNTYRGSASHFGFLLYPAAPFPVVPVGHRKHFEPKTVMQTLSIPLRRIQESAAPARLNLNAITGITLRMNRRASGVLYVDDLQLTA